MPRQRPSTLRRGFGRFKHPRVQETLASILVVIPVNRAVQFNAAIVSATGSQADGLTFGGAGVSADGAEPVTHYVAEFRISDALDTRSLVQQLAAGNNPDVQAVLWPDGNLGDLATLQADYSANPNIDIRSTRPDLTTWLAEHGLQRVSAVEELL